MLDKQKISFPEFVMLWDQVQGLSMPPHHLRISSWLGAAWEGGQRELLLMAFRSSGKSTLVGLFCAWVLMRVPDLRIMVLAADFALAKKMVRNVKRIIERHPLTKGLKPARLEQWASDQFTIKRPGELRDPSMLAKGIGANITGSRADVVICDDIEVPNTCDSAQKRQDLRLRLQEIDYVLVPGGLQMYVGTPHTYYTIYAKELPADSPEDVPFLAGFERLELPLLTPEGYSQWPERFPMSSIDGIRRRTGRNKFESQMMLRPVNMAESRLDPDLLVAYDDEIEFREQNGLPRLYIQGQEMKSASCWWDPSFGSPDRGDGSVIAVIFTDASGKYWLHAVRYLKVDPQLIDRVDEATQLCRQVCAFLAEFSLPSVLVETNGLGKFLPGLLRKELRAQDFSCAVVEKHSRVNKVERILSAFDVILASRSLWVHKSVWRTPFIAEMREWQPISGARDDGLDAVAGCLLSEPVRIQGAFPHIRGKLGKAGWHGHQAQIADSDFSV